jgi:chemotaxis methyl-accepting protein methylase
MSRLSPKDLDRVRRWLSAEGVTRPGEYRDTFLERRVQARMESMGARSIRDLLDCVDAGPKLREAFFQKFFVPTTEFLRNPEVLEEFVRLLTEMAPASKGPLRILSAGSSTGQEAYGVAALLRERGREFRILAIDRSVPSLRTLRAGRYEERLLAKVDKRLRERYFIREAGAYRVSGELASRVAAACWDLGVGLPRGPFHGVLLRNVLIYLTEEAKLRLLGEVSKILLPGGLLALGRAESAGHSALGVLVPRDREKRIYERRAEGRLAEEGG